MSDHPVISARNLSIPVGSRPVIMGILNVNDDSFSDPGARTLDGLLEQAAAMVSEGAAILDLGAQSAITGRPPVDARVESERVVPLVAGLVEAFPGVAISVDTYKLVVADAVLDAGAHIVNDVSGLAEPGIAASCGHAGAALVLMHTAAPPLVRRQDPSLYDDVATEVAGSLAAATAQARDLGVARESIIVDPGIDFTKTPAQSVELLRNVDQIVALGYPILLALSRKDFVGALVSRTPAARDPGTIGAITALRHVPSQILRVHDVAATRDALVVYDALTGSDPIPPDLAVPEHLRHARPFPFG